MSIREENIFPCRSFIPLYVSVSAACASRDVEEQPEASDLASSFPSSFGDRISMKTPASLAAKRQIVPCFLKTMLAFTFVGLAMPSASAFASNLIVTTMGCMTELSTDEVIMNNVVKSPEESDFPKMHLEVVSDDNHEAPENEIRIAFVNPYSTEEFNEDIQFVMEVGLVTEEGTEDAPPAPASFVNGGTIGCENDKRVAARYMDKHGQVTLKIQDDTVPLKVWAGWATGQNPVRLTPSLILNPKPVTLDRNGNTEQNKDGVAGNHKTPNNNNESAAKPLKQMLQNLQKEVPEELSSVKEARPGHHNTKQKIAHTLSKDKLDGSRAQNIAESIKKKQLELDLKAKNTRKIEEDKDVTRDDDEAAAVASGEMTHKRQERDARTKAQKSRLDAQKRRNVGSSSDDLDMTWHLVGCGFFVVCMGGILIAFGKKRDKGRRDL